MSTWLAKADLLLVGCVKYKRRHAAPAKDLYDSTLWRCRRAYAEISDCPWFILSARHGLLAPDVEIEPYELALSDLPVAKRREWSLRVLDHMIAAIPALEGKTIEIHAGKEYVKYGLEEGLKRLDVIVQRLLAHIGLFQQPAWYRNQVRKRAP